jgi:pantoate--beta-alanine ligase
MSARRPLLASVLRVATAIDTPSGLRDWSDTMRLQGHTIALVPTMGALHRGHLELIDAARRFADRTVVSIFVNPLQFGESVDFDRYPRPLETDLRACTDAGVDVVYVPTAATMYPDGFSTAVRVSGLTDSMEGASRPGHFDGVTTVVTKLFAASRPHAAIFGEKDYQQLATVRRMVLDLDLGIEIVAHPTVREDDGLAMSSRNRRLDVDQRRAATCVSKAISAAQLRARTAGRTQEVIDAARAIIDDEPLAEVDYVSVFDAISLDQLDPFAPLVDDDRRPGRARIAVAARFGDVRLIDNADLFSS